MPPRSPADHALRLLTYSITHKSWNHFYGAWQGRGHLASVWPRNDPSAVFAGNVSNVLLLGPMLEGEFLFSFTLADVNPVPLDGSGVAVRSLCSILLISSPCASLPLRRGPGDVGTVRPVHMCGGVHWPPALRSVFLHRPGGHERHRVHPPHVRLRPPHADRGTLIRVMQIVPLKRVGCCVMLLRCRENGEGGPGLFHPCAGVLP